MINNDFKYEVQYTSQFKKNFKKVLRQGKDEKKFIDVLKKIANGEKLDLKYRNHSLMDDKLYKGCYECHINPDWLLVYRIVQDKLILLLVATGSHSELFGK